MDSNETSPTTGSMRNDQLGLALAFNSEAMNVRQSEFLAFDHFRDQSCRIYETLWQTLGINRVNVPSLRFQLQKGFSEERADEAEAFLWKMKLSDPNPKLLAVLGGEHAAFDFTVVTEQEVKDAGVPILQRRRFQASVVRQAKQQTLDSRILQRASLLPAKQNEASGDASDEKQSPGDRTGRGASRCRTQSRARVLHQGSRHGWFHCGVVAMGRICAELRQFNHEGVR